MTIRKKLLGLLPLYLAFLALSAESPQTPQQLVELSRKASDLSAVGSYQLQATVVLNPGTSKEVSGPITLFRDKGLYHSDLKLIGYRETRWIKEQTLYIARTQAIPIPTLLVLRELDHLWRAPIIPDGVKTLKQSKEKHHGIQLDCFESNQSDWRNKFCFDPATSALAKAHGLEFHDVEFQDFGTFEQKYFPGKIIVKDQDKTVLEIRNITISKAKFSADMFDPPKNATALATCDDLTPARKIKDVDPEIPFDELRRARSAVVYLYGFIATDGSVQNISVEYSPSNAFTESARNAFQQWRYKPATCGDKPVATEIETHILYSVR
jgi:hypothetical protein